MCYGGTYKLCMYPSYLPFWWFLIDVSCWNQGQLFLFSGRHKSLGELDSSLELVKVEFFFCKKSSNPRLLNFWREANLSKIQPCVNRCAATALAGLTAARHALEGRLLASIQSCVEDHARYLLRLVSVSPVPPEITFTPVASGFSHYNDIRPGISTLPAVPYSWLIGWATLGWWGQPLRGVPVPSQNSLEFCWVLEK